MAVQIGNAILEVDADTKPAAKQIDSFAGGLSKKGGTAGRNLASGFRRTAVTGMKVAAAAAGAAAVGAIAVAMKGVSAAVDFDVQMREVFTLLPDISQEAMDEMSGQVKDFSTEFGVLPQKTVPALYQALSAGVPKDNVFEFLETAQKAAKGGVAELETAVDGISSVTNAYGSEVLGAAEASDLMFTAVRLGKTNFDQLSQSLFNVTPTAAGLGVEFGDVTAAIAALTAQGVPTRVATTQLRQLFVELSKDGGDAAKTFEDLAGKSFKDFIAAGGNTADALEIMLGGAKDLDVGVNDLFGSVEAGQAALSLAGSENFTAALDEMAKSTGATEAAFETMDQGLKPTIDRLKAMGQVALINIGEFLIPKIEQAVEVVQRHWPQISKVIKSVQREVVAAIDWLRLNVLPGLITAATAVVDWFTRNWSTIRSTIATVFDWLVNSAWPIVQTVLRAIITAAQATVTWFQTNWPAIRATIQDVIDWLQTVAWPIVQQVIEFIRAEFQSLVTWTETNWPKVRETIQNVINAVRVIIEKVTTAIRIGWELFGDEIVSVVQSRWNTMKTLIQEIINIIRGIINTVTSLITGDWQGAWDGIKTILSGVWNAMRALVDDVLVQIKALISAASSVIQATLTNPYHKARDLISSALDAVVNFVRKLPGRILAFQVAYAQAVLNTIAIAFQKGRDLAGEAMDAVVQFVRDLPGNILNLAGQVLSAFTTVGEKIIEGIWAGIGSLTQIGIDLVTGIASGIASAAGSIASAVWDAIPTAGEIRSHVSSAVSSALSIGRGGNLDPADFGFGDNRQHGGPVMAGVPYVVGEAGRELFIPQVSGMVVPNSMTEKYLSGAPSVTVNVDARGSSDPSGVARAAEQGTLSALAQWTTARGRLG